MADSPLHKAPIGLLELLRLRTLGQQPNLFEQRVSPVVDVTDFYGLDTVNVVNNQSGAQALPIQVISQFGVGVPQAISRMLALSGNCSIGANAGTFLVMTLGLTRQNGGPFVWLNQIQIDNPQPNIGYTITAMIPFPFLVQSGWQIVFLAQGDASGADHQGFLNLMQQVLDPGA